jgi:hypothetical protein
MSVGRTVKEEVFGRPEVDFTFATKKSEREREIVSMIAAGNAELK